MPEPAVELLQRKNLPGDEIFRNGSEFRMFQHLRRGRMLRDRIFLQIKDPGLLEADLQRGRIRSTRRLPLQRRLRRMLYVRHGMLEN